MLVGVRTRLTAAALVAALAVSLVIPVGAFANNVGDATAFPGSGGPVKINPAPHQVYAVNLNAGDWIVAYGIDAALADVNGDGDLTFPEDASGQWKPAADIRVFGPSATDVTVDTPLVSIGQDDWLQFKAETSGTYYLDFGQTYAPAGGVMSGMFLSRPYWTLSTPTNVVTNYGAKVAIKGTLKDSMYNYITGYGPEVELTPNAYLGKSANGVDGWSIASTDALAMTDEAGRFSWTVAPTTKTYYQLAFFGWADWDYGIAETFSPVVRVTPKVYLTKKAPTTAYKGRTFGVSGYLKPRKTAGTYPVRIEARRAGTSTIYSFRGKASNYSSYSAYKAGVKLNTRGKWQVRAYFPGDSKNAATYTSWSYVTVK